jgi:hypothetical protein
MTEKWKGIHKLIEEAGEVLQLCGKIGAFPDTPHPSGEDIEARLWDELADLQAAIDYFKDQNLPPIHGTYSRAQVVHVMIERRERKMAKFRTWVLTGLRCG